MNKKAVGDQKVALVGNRARSEAELAIEATEYVSRGLAGRGGVVQGLRGFWHKTLPMWTGQVRSLSPVAIIGLTLRVLFVVLAGVIPIFGRRAVSPQFAQSTLIDTLAGTYASLSPMDWLLASIGIAVYAVPKMLDRVGKRRLAGVHRPFTDLAAAIDKVPELPADSNVAEALRLVLAALCLEMSQLVDDPASPEITEVTLLQYCDDIGSQMQVTARTNVNERTHFPMSARRFLANYVARKGRWFAEHDFTNRRNPFKPKRLTVPGAPPVPYRSVLYMPITTVRPAAHPPNFTGPEPRNLDCCIGVICVHTTEPFRFWRWGDQRKGAGGGFGNVAMQRALPYIALIKKLIADTAFCVELEDAHD